jgi:outer membrane receptor protein involved in Fe transport
MLDAVPPPPSEVIVVTGKALPDTAGERAYQVDDLSARDLQDRPGNTLDEILQVAGLQLFRRSDSTSGHPTSQGVTLRALGGNASSRALLILDGVPQTDPFGGWVNWPAYDPAGLGRVQIVRGGGSVANGSGALAGTIEMESLNTPGLNATIEGGSRRSIRGHLYEGATFGGSLLSIDAQGGRSEGFIPVTSATRGLADRRGPCMRRRASACAGRRRFPQISKRKSAP